MLVLYRRLLRLYPPAYRCQYGEEMVAVFLDAKSDAWEKGLAARAAFCLREIAGLLRGMLNEHVHSLFGSHLFAPRRFAMRSEFRFPKSTTILMFLILAGVVLAIEKASSIEASIPYANPQLPAIHPVPPTFAPATALTFAVVYAVAIVAWIVLFALRRSGVHRLENLITGAGQK
jgi:hypothetical protein